jgi:hypothetical protein
MGPALIALVMGAVALAYAGFQGPSNLIKLKKGKHTFWVQNLPHKEQAVARMASIRSKLETLLTRYRDNPATAADPRIQRLLSNFNPNNLMEANMGAGTTSYSENKGDRIVICLRQKTKGYPFVDENTVMFVVLHEMAHLMTASIGHTPEFWANFRRLLQDAVSAGVYTDVNYAHDPAPYCGIMIDSSP